MDHESLAAELRELFEDGLIGGFTLAGVDPVTGICHTTKGATLEVRLEGGTLTIGGVTATSARKALKGKLSRA